MTYRPNEILDLLVALHDGEEDWNAKHDCHVFQALLGDELIQRNRDDSGAGPTKEGLAVIRAMRRGGVDLSQILRRLEHTARVADHYAADPL